MYGKADKSSGLKYTSFLSCTQKVTIRKVVQSSSPKYASFKVLYTFQQVLRRQDLTFARRPRGSALEGFE
jgi:hypothetical protein